MSLHLVCPHCFATNRVPASRLGEAPKCGRCHEQLLPAKPVDLATSQFDAFIRNNDLPVVVDFWAGWCGPCKMMAPAFASVAGNLSAKIRFAKVDTEAEQAIAARYQIRSIPSLLVFKNGQEVARQAGAMSAPQLHQWLQQFV